MATESNTKNLHAEELYNLISFGQFEVRGNNTPSDSSSKGSKDIADDFKVNEDSNSDDKWASWGADNNLPDELIGLVGNNTIALGLIGFKKDMITSPSNFLYKQKTIQEGNKVKVIEELVEDSKIQDYFEENNLREYLIRCAMDYSFSGNTFTEFVKSKDGSKYLFEHKDFSDCRVSTIKSKKNKAYLYSDWANVKENDVEEVPLYDKAKEVQPSKFIYHAKSYFPGSKHYGVPEWIGARNWLILTNKIPVFKIANMENGSNIRFHIQVPHDYFLKLFPPGQFSDEQRKEKEVEFKRNLEKFLAGEKNAGKMILSKFVKEMDKVVPGLIIDPVEYKLNDDAYLPDFEQSNQAFTSAIGIDPSIANIQTQGKLSSGSDKRNGFNIYTKTRLFSAREKILEPIYKIMRINGFDKDVKIGFTDFELETLDTNKEGAKII
ncbi:hypothetical protein AD998_07620 [bacterium 336/3]|nr:hypothetical protein AD998_07620 [bacterium 336/3]